MTARASVWRPVRAGLPVLVAVSSLGSGCAAIEEGPDRAPSTVDALVSGNFDRGPRAEAGIDATTPRTDTSPQTDAGLRIDAAIGPCTPGQYVDFCSLCDADGVAGLPPDGRDSQCPAVDCAGLTRYEGYVDDEGRPSCRIILHNPSGPNCAAQGTCVTEPDDTVCVARPAVRTAVVEQPCTTIVGCSGATEGTIGPAPVGTPCAEGAGQCNAAGQCDTRVTEQCGDFAVVGTVCGVGTDPGFGAWCSVAPPADLGATTCSQVCLAASSSCGAAYRAGATVCEQGMQVGCIASEVGLLCLCRQR